MTAHFEAPAERCDLLLVIQGGFRILGSALETFKPGPGQYAEFQLRVIEVQSGRFPTHIDQISINANGWEIYRADDPSIPELVSFNAYDRIIGGLELLKNYDEDAYYVVAEHDELFAGPDPSKVSAAHLKELAELGWTPSSAGNLSTFV